MTIHKRGKQSLCKGLLGFFVRIHSKPIVLYCYQHHVIYFLTNVFCIWTLHFASSPCTTPSTLCLCLSHGPSLL
ncbi:Os01g0719100, partial [Oryza sativa Japonica Group]